MFHVLGMLLSPLLLVQGLYVRKTIELLPEPEGRRAGCEGEGGPLRLLVLGDSAAAGVGAGHQEEALVGHLVGLLSKRFAVEWELMAEAGATSADAIGWLEQRDARAFDVAVVSLGVNDVTALSSVGRFLRHQRRVVELLRSRWGVEQVVLSALPPVGQFPALPQPLRWFLGSRSESFDRALQGLAEELSASRVDIKLDLSQDISMMARDGFHPGPEIYRRWATLVEQLL